MTAVEPKLQSGAASQRAPDDRSPPADHVVDSPGGKGGERSLADTAYEEIKRRILSLQMRPGIPFTESELAEILQLGKTPIREALLRLRIDGLVEAQARSGYRVSPVTLKDARDVCELRSVLDGEAAHLLAARGGRDVAEFRAITAADPGVTPPNSHRWVEMDRSFHEALGHATGNARLADGLSQVLGHFARLCHLSLALDRRAVALMHDHDALISAINEADAPRARQLAVEQAQSAQSCIMDALLSSESIATANVDLGDGPAHTFYLDIPRDRT
jgi:DNA-binding GntR family transcriptional regulator